MDRKLEKAIEETRLATKELLQEFIGVLNNTVSKEEKYQQVLERWFKARSELENLGASMAIGEFEFKYSVYKKILERENLKNQKKLSLSDIDNKFLRSLKIIPPNDEKNKK